MQHPPPPEVSVQTVLPFSPEKLTIDPPLDAVKITPLAKQNSVFVTELEKPTDKPPSHCNYGQGSPIGERIQDLSPSSKSETFPEEVFESVYDSTNQMKVQAAKALLKEVYRDTDVFVTIDPDTVIYQDIAKNPYLGTADRIAQVYSILEELQADVQDLTVQLASALPDHRSPRFNYASSHYPPFESPPCYSTASRVAPPQMRFPPAPRAPPNTLRNPSTSASIPQFPAPSVIQTQSGPATSRNSRRRHHRRTNKKSQ